MSLYSRLFWRAPSAIKETKEDFLSEALGDILTRLSQPEAQQFIENILLKNIRHRCWVAQFMLGLGSKQLVWETQYRIIAPNKNFDRRRPDLVLFADRCPMLVVEAKVDAATDEDQLQAYGSWLAHEARASRRHTAVGTSAGSREGARMRRATKHYGVWAAAHRLRSLVGRSNLASRRNFGWH